MNHFGQCSINARGYSEIILQPCYLVSIVMIFLLLPHFGLLISSIIIGVPAFAIAYEVARRQNERYERLRVIAFNKAEVDIDVQELDRFLRYLEPRISVNIIKRADLLGFKFRLSQSEAERLTREIIRAKIALPLENYRQNYPEVPDAAFSYVGMPGKHKSYMKRLRELKILSAPT